METQRRSEAGNFRRFSGDRGESVTTAKNFTILLVDDHVMFRRGIRRIIEETPNLRVVGEANDGLEALDLLKEFIPDLVILAISMPRCGGLAASREIKRLYPDLKLMFLTMHRDEEYMQRALSVGVEGYLLKGDADDELIEAISALSKGKTYFAPLRTKYEACEPLRRTTWVQEIAW